MNPTGGESLHTCDFHRQNRNGIIDTKYTLRLPGDWEVVLPDNLRTLCYLIHPLTKETVYGNDS
jgi:hypothetical protein